MSREIDIGRRFAKVHGTLLLHLALPKTDPRRLTCFDLAVWTVIDVHYSSRYGRAWPEHARIAKILDKHPRAVGKSIERLERAGVLRIIARGAPGGRGNAYVTRVPSESQDSLSEAGASESQDSLGGDDSGPDSTLGDDGVSEPQDSPSRPLPSEPQDSLEGLGAASRVSPRTHCERAPGLTHAGSSPSSGVKENYRGESDARVPRPTHVRAGARPGPRLANGEAAAAKVRAALDPGPIAEREKLYDRAAKAFAAAVDARGGIFIELQHPAFRTIATLADEQARKHGGDAGEILDAWAREADEADPWRWKTWCQRRAAGAKPLRAARITGGSDSDDDFEKAAAADRERRNHA